MTDTRDTVGSKDGSIGLRSVSKSYGTQMAVDDISLAVASGECVVLLGPSGSGKSTLLNLIAGFVRPDSGTILIGSRDVSDVPAYERDVGVQFQDYVLFPHMTAGANIAFPLEVRGYERREVAQRVDEALEMVHLSGLNDRYPHQLSGGQQQRIALARALVYRPSVLLLDEPLGALDRRLRDEMQREFRRLHRMMGNTFIYVTHDQAEALALADRIVLVRAGQIEQIGPPREVYDRPRTAFVADFLGDCNLWVGNGEQVANSRVVRHETGVLLHRGTAAGESCEGSVSVAARPEWIQLSDCPYEGGEERASIAGVVREQRFAGSEVMVYLDTELGSIAIRTGSTGVVLQDGQTAYASWLPEATVPVESR